MDALSRSVELAKSKADLHAEIDDLTERDSVVLIIGLRREQEDGSESSSVRMRERNAFGFESIGLIERARQRMFQYYEKED